MDDGTDKVGNRIVVWSMAVGQALTEINNDFCVKESPPAASVEFII